MTAHDDHYAVTCHRLSCAFTGLPKQNFDNFAMHCAALGEAPGKVAKLRCVQLHAALSRVAVNVPGLAAHVAFYIQCHVPAATFTGTVMQLHRDKRQPEASEGSAFNCYPFTRNHQHAARGWHAQHCDDATNPLSKLIRKGGPAPSSVRYVAGLLRRCATSTMETQLAVRDMVCAKMLGGYRHSSKTPNLDVHARTVVMSTHDLVDECVASTSNKQLHAMVSEYVCANTLDSPALAWSVGEVAAKHMDGVTRGCLRLYGKDTAPSQPTNFSVFMTMARALNVNTSIAANVACGNPKGMFAPSLATLDALGATQGDVRTVHECFSARNAYSLKTMRTRLKTLDKSLVAPLRHHVWHSMQSVRIQSVPMAVHVMRRQATVIAAQTQPYAHAMQLCTTCCTPRCAVIGLPRNKSSAGILTNLHGGATLCNNCQSPTIIVVHMLGRLVTILPRRFDRTPCNPTHIAICCGCARLTTFTSSYGAYPLCDACKMAAQVAMCSPKSCLCGANVGPNAPWTTVTNNDGTISVATLCKSHEHLLPDHAVPRDVLQNAVTPRTKRQKTK